MKFKQSRGMLFLKERGIAFCLRHRLVKLRMKLLEKISLFVFRFFVKRVENYRFAVFFYGLSGHYALRKMFEFLGYEEVKIHDGEFSKCYYNALRKLKGRGEYFLSFRFYDNDLKDYTHNVTKVIKNTNILILVRDPISRLKTLINHGHNIKPYELNALNSPISLDIIRYEGNVKPSCNGLYDALDTLAFNYYSVVKPLLDAGGGGILYIDTQELMPSCAFETFEKLSQGLEISPPKKALKAKFEYKFWNPLSLLLPYYLYLSSKDFAKIPAIVLHVEENIIKNCQNSYVDIKSYILDPCDLHYENLAINVLKKNAHFILENEEILKALKNYFKQFVLILEEKVQLRQKYAINEEAILSYLKENHTTAKKLKDILELELTHIKQVRPDIIASWKYYAEFEKIWEKLELSRS